MQRASEEARAKLRSAMHRLAVGERAALEEIYRATSAKLFGICLRILGDEKEAEDALQDVYLTLWRRADRYDPERASPIAWLATFARNRAVDRLRTGKVRRGSVSVADAEPLADTQPLAEAMLIDAEREARVHTCLDTLDETPRDAIRTAFFEGRTYAELAEAQKVPLGTMKSWIRRGLAKLKACMEAGE
ncbi:sigma-70 family RNA polymerase sigma factor [Qipengyuania sp. 6B39]|uniref:sigma-70 family RNA polymerase sigma factor n=1 Tax=Qipengyuania proteolytica TaxID=2867239 RepID=UPI001C8AB5BF|nr:sigma-70 family RNA polymerase sigma factor [Qipengyuania proteolytica]MBX7496812.1 sigma-70 family RNA polymerase sigma factor [Qipengyuania proteolytica]